MKYFWLLFLLGCASKENFPENPLVKKILSPRIGYKTLTNTFHNADGSVGVREYDLNDIEIRKTLKELGFRCNVGGKIYFICANGPGLCRREDDIITGWGPFKKHHENFAPSIDINDRYQFLLDAKTRCESDRVEKAL